MTIKKLIPIAFVPLLASCSTTPEEWVNLGTQVIGAVLQGTPATPAQLPTSFGIGTGENTDKTHAAFGGVPTRLTSVRTWVKVNQVPDKGLNFFALQVNFNNGTWAHGGLQYNKGTDWVANWGGLVNRGGGSKDYTDADPANDLAKIQNTNPTTRLYAWQLGTTYELIIWRGDKITLPAGEYEFMDKKVYLPKPRTMWQWHFVAKPAHGGKAFESVMYNSADSFKDFYVWNECGYGSCNLPQHATWYLPQYATQDAPTKYEQTQSHQYF